MKTLKRFALNPLSKNLQTLLFCLIMLFNAMALVAQSTVIGLRVNGQNVPSANTTVMPPGQGSSSSQITKGQQLVSGTRLIIPSGTTVMLQSPGGKQICSSTQGKSMEYTVKITSQGENHVVKGKGAQVQSVVSKSVGYNYRVNNGRGTTSAARGTEFTFTDMSEENRELAVISTQEGSINIIDEVPLNIGGQAGKDKRGNPLTKSIASVQNQGDGNYNSTNQPVYYNDYSQAISYLASEVNAIVDQEEKADNLLCLGDLYMDVDQPQNAANVYYQAYSIFYNFYGEDDLDTLEAELSVADALAYSDQADEAYKYLNHARNILLEMEQFDIEDLDYLSQLDYYDEEEAFAICDELSDIYDLLGWSYEIEGDDDQSDHYYQSRDNVCN